MMLLNYPRLHEQYLYSDNYELHLCLSPTTPTYNWVELRNDLISLEIVVTKEHVTAEECEAAVRELQHALEKKYGLNIHGVTIYNNSWVGVFDLAEGALVEIHSPSMGIPPA